MSAVHEFSAWTEDADTAPDIICGWRSVGRCGFGLFACRRKCTSGSRNTWVERTDYEQSVGQDHAREGEYQYVIICPEPLQTKTCRIHTPSQNSRHPSGTLSHPPLPNYSALRRNRQSALAEDRLVCSQPPPRCDRFDSLTTPSLAPYITRRRVPISTPRIGYEHSNRTRFHTPALSDKDTTDRVIAHHSAHFELTVQERPTPSLQIAPDPSQSRTTQISRLTCLLHRLRRLHEPPGPSRRAQLRCRTMATPAGRRNGNHAAIARTTTTLSRMG
jgi:hypothetical protein